MSAPERKNWKRALLSLFSSHKPNPAVGLSLLDKLLPRNLGVKPLLFGFLIIIALLVLLLVISRQDFSNFTRVEALKNFDAVAAQQADVLDQHVEQATEDVLRFRAYIKQLSKEQDESELEELRKLMATSLQMRPLQFSYFFAFEPIKARKLFKKPAFVGALYKNTSLRNNSVAYNAPENMIFSSWPDTHYLKNNREQWYHQNKGKQAAQKTDVFFDKNYTKATVFSVTQGIYDANRFQGMVGIHILADSFFEQVENLTLGEEGGAFLVDRSDGTIISKTPGALFGTHDRMQFNLLKTTGESELWEDLIKQGGQKPSFSGRDGFDYVVSASPLKEMPWTLIIYQSTEELSLTEQSSVLLWGLFFLLALVTLLASIFWFKLIIPLQSLATPTSDGGFALRIPANALNEVQSVADVLHRLDNALSKISAEKTLANRQLQECEHKLEEDQQNAEQRENRLSALSMENQRLRLQQQNLKKSW